MDTLALELPYYHCGSYPVCRRIRRPWKTALCRDDTMQNVLGRTHYWKINQEFLSEY